jgi:hypothetical protein
MSEDNQPITVWKVLSTIGQGVARSVQLIGEGANAAVGAVQSTSVALRDAMPVTEIITLFNTTDKIIRFINRETPRDTRDILGQSHVSLKTEQAAGAWIPWFDPPRFDDFSRRRVEIVIDDIPVLFIWQRGDFVYWSNRLDAEGRPAKAYKMAGVNHAGGQRTLVVRNDPEAGYSAFLAKPIPT